MQQALSFWNLPYYCTKTYTINYYHLYYIKFRSLEVDVVELMFFADKKLTCAKSLEEEILLFLPNEILDRIIFPFIPPLEQHYLEQRNNILFLQFKKESTIVLLIKLAAMVLVHEK